MTIPAAHARSSDPQTSHDAARSVKDISKAQRHVMMALNREPMTDEQISSWMYEWLGSLISPSGARTRRAELVAMGLVEDSGQRGKTKAGRATIIWRAK
jgi:hypothetical protein